MTITNTTVSQTFSGDGTTVNFSIPFQFQDTSEIVVYLIDVSTAVQTLLALTTDYTLTGGTVAQPTTVTTVATYTSQKQVLITRVTADTQKTSYTQNGVFPAKSHENALDKLTQRIQELDAEISSPTLPLIVPVINGGTGATAKNTGFDALSPMSASGDMIYGGASGTGTRLPKGTDGQVLQLLSGLPVWSSSASSSPGGLYNIGLKASVASNNLTLALKQQDGNTDASASSPVTSIFRDATIANGDYISVSATAALSIVAASGATFGQISAQNQFVHVYLLNNAGAIELALSGSRIFDESSVQSTTAISASSTSSTVLYSTTARTNVAVRYVGVLKFSLSTAGTYASGPTNISLFPSNRQTQQRSTITVDGCSGHGSTNTKVPLFVNTRKNNGNSDLTVTNSATLGTFFTVLTPGTYKTTLHFTTTDATAKIGITVNDSAPTTAVDSLTYAQGLRALGNTGNTGATAFASFEDFYQPGDLIYPHDNGGTPSNTALCMMTVCKTGD